MTHASKLRAALPRREATVTRAKARLAAAKIKLAEELELGRRGAQQTILGLEGELEVAQINLESVRGALATEERRLLEPGSFLRYV